MRWLFKIFMQSPPYGAKCPECGSTDIADSSDGYHWKCNSCGHRFTTAEIQY